MDKREIAVLACRILSIFTFARIGPHLGSIASVMPFYSRPAMLGQMELVVVFAQLMPILTLLALAVCLWTFADQIAFFMTAKMKPAENPTPIDSRSILGLTMVVGGALILVDALAKFNGYFIYITFVQQNTQINPEQHIKWTTDFVLFVIKTIVGLFMLIKPYSIVDYLQRKQQTPFFPNADGE